MYTYIGMCYMKMDSGFSAEADLLLLSDRCNVPGSDSHADFFNDIIKFF